MNDLVKNFDVNEGTTWRWFQWHIVQQHRNTRYLTLLCSRQHGKTRYGVELIMDFIFRYTKRQNPLVVVTMPTAEQVYDVWFTRLHHKLAPLLNLIYTKQGSRGSALSMTIHRTWLEKPDYVTIEFHGSGNPKALKGRTADLIVGDEMAFVTQTFWTQVLEPMLDDTDGKALLTSTINGHNWFSNLCDGHRKMNNHKAKHIEFNPLTAQLRSDRWVKDKESYARATDGWQDYLREYWHDRTAASYEEAPFSFYVSQLKSKGQRRQMSEFYEPNVINVSIDIGKKGNNAVWYWVYDGKIPLVIDYRDDHYNNYELLRELPDLHPHKVFNVILPADADQPVFEGDTATIKLREFIKNNHLDRIININVLPKTKPKTKIELIRNGVELLGTAHFLSGNDNIEKGLKKLASTLHPKNKDKVIDQTKFLKNDMQHAADAWCYVWGAINEGYANDLSHLQRLTIDGLDNTRPVSKLSNRYKGFDIC